MKIIGFRNSTNCLRYAILNWDGEIVSFKNKVGEHSLKYPAGLENTDQKLKWLHDEVTRILTKNPDAECVGLKVSEYGRAEKKSSRYTSYADSIVFLTCAQNNLSIYDFIYSQLPTTSQKVKAYAEGLSGKTDKYWDTQISDAIAVAVAARKKTNG